MTKVDVWISFKEKIIVLDLKNIEEIQKLMKVGIKLDILKIIFFLVKIKHIKLLIKTFFG